MKPASPATVFIVDDDAGARDALAWLLRTRSVASEAFDSAEAFQRGVLPRLTGAAPRLPGPCCAVLDVRMPGLSGLALFDALLTAGVLAEMPVIFLSGHADLPTAVDAVRRGAFDFCEKPFSDNALVDRIEQALLVSAQAQARRQQREAVLARVDELTERERDVMRCVAEGLLNKLIADQLGISVRTVEVHRSRVFEKLGVRSAVELVNLLQGLG